MKDWKPYRKRQNQPVVAVQLNLDTDGFDYRQWGGQQHCKPGDWIVCNGDSTYTIDQQSFALTYRSIGGGSYVKVATTWAERMPCAGQVSTKEGITHYQAGDYLVSNDQAGTDTYAITADAFEAMYEPLAAESESAADRPVWLRLGRTVRLVDCDAAGVMQPPALRRWCQEAWEESLERFGMDVAALHDSWTAADAAGLALDAGSVHIERPLRWGETLQLTLEPRRLEASRCRIEVQFRCRDEAVARGLCDLQASDAAGHPCPLPPAIDRWLTAAAATD